jgi:hypothetical protein
MDVPSSTFAADADGPLARLIAAVERQLDAAERMTEKLVTAQADPRDLEGATRALALIARTTRELIDMRGALETQPSEPRQDNECPRDVEELRRELARELDALVAEQQGTRPQQL